ncbi:hypothetical protein RR42_m1865 [Cupriavidus basilensis]|uniref:Uncharacterized protein n=1 Tax=Cupriavidus basilensis TaxID=68895 RepID=A0A0C4Y8E8_9BURK|nr:hypothetical protein RR42_m1865 [Cupriavidus basilensis]
MRADDTAGTQGFLGRGTDRWRRHRRALYCDKPLVPGRKSGARGLAVASPLRLSTRG